MVKVCPGVDLSKRMVPPSPGPGGDLKSVITVKAGNVFEVFHPEHRSKAWYANQTNSFILIALPLS
jgi:hypothetical protein